MIDGQRVLAIIPARGGSKGLPRKNVLPLAGKPLIAWTIEAAQKSRYIDRVILSSDDEEIIGVARQSGCDVPFVRPAALAADASGTMDVLRHALAEVPGFDVVVLLQPTSPLRAAGDIDATVEDCVQGGRPASVTVTPSAKPPEWMYRRDGAGCLSPVLPDVSATRRQELPPAYVVNGAVYAARVDWLLEHGSFVGPETGSVVMPQERSVDIDTAFDLAVAELVLQHIKESQS
jgi:CMP-N,N'-diacetyllegionaminic acid synthase